MADQKPAANPAEAMAEAGRQAAEAAARALQMNAEMGRQLVEAWTKSLENMANAAKPAAAPAMPTPANSANPFFEVGQVWLNAMTEATRRTQAALAKGEPLTPESYADIWSNAAAEISQKVVTNAAFAQTTGKLVDAASQARQEARRRAEQQLAELGFATRADVEEVGKRLIQMERRVHELTLMLEDKPKKSGK